MSSDAEKNPLVEGDSEDEFDWEEVEVPEHEPQEPQHLEITLQARPKPDAVKQKKGISHAERLIRIDCHKIHTIILLGNAQIRNKWINDPLLHARLMSLTPLPLQNAFGMIHKSRVPDQLHRGRMFETAMSNLVTWWANDFFEVVPEGHIRNRTFDEVQRRMDLFIKNDQNSEEPLNIETLQDILDDDGEKIRSEKSLMKHALMQSGSRDTSAQLFTALCRALGIPARLVVSLQCVPWKAGVGKPKPKYERKAKGSGKGKGKEKATAENDEEAGMEEVDIPRSASVSVSSSDSKRAGKAFEGNGQRLDGGSVPPKSDKAKGKEKAKATPVIKLRKTKSKGQTLGSSSRPPQAGSSRLASPDPITTPPVFWTEVFSRPDGRWLPVDPIRAIVNKRKVFDPSSTSTITVPITQTFGSTSLANPYAVTTVTSRASGGFREENRMLYVLAFEEDGYARDVTRRYAKEYGAKIAKLQGGNIAGGGGKGRQAWWDRVVNDVKRPYRLHRDDVEDDELETAQMMEGMPTTMAGFKDHPLYVLTKHLKQTETIHPAPPSTPELGKFRGEPVYPRSAVVSLKTSENWMRSEGRMVKAGCQPIKFIKARAGTVNRIRELEFMKDELKEAGSASPGPGTSAGGEAMQGLYARSQTEPYIPNPVVDGKVPKNNFGNIDLYVPSMLPKGAVHIPFKGVAKIARKLGFDFAEAVTGFEFKKRRAFPIIEGVVVAADNEPALLEAYWEAEQEAQEKARAKREDRILKQWSRLVKGLAIRKRLQDQYATKPDEENISHQPTVDESAESVPEKTQTIVESDGGFLVGADDVVEAFHLPKYQHVPMAPTPSSKAHIPKVKDSQELAEATSDDSLDFHTYDLETMDVDSDMEIPIQSSAEKNIPKTMQELAEEAASEAKISREHDLNPGFEELGATPQPVVKTGPTIKIIGLKKIATAQNGSRETSSSATSKRSRTTTSRRSSARKRARKGASEDEAEPSEEENEPSPKKRMLAKAPLAVPPPTRTLRPRTSKTAAQLAEEREAEEAYKRATSQ